MISATHMKKTEADNLIMIKISFLKKHGYFHGERSGVMTWTNGWSDKKSSIGITVPNNNEFLQLTYTQTDRNDEKKSFDYQVPLTTTPCRFGGKRYWFICQMSREKKYCGRRVGVLYKDGDYFACRHCYNLTYSSRTKNRRYKFLPLYETLFITKRMDELDKEIKRPYYRGEPTKKQRKWDMLYLQLVQKRKRFGDMKDI